MGSRQPLGLVGGQPTGPVPPLRPWPRVSCGAWVALTLPYPCRMASCGRGGVRLWRLRRGGLRSCAVDLGEHHALEFTDLAFGQDLDSCTL